LRLANPYQNRTRNGGIDCIAASLKHLNRDLGRQK